MSVANGGIFRGGQKFEKVHFLGNDPVRNLFFLLKSHLNYSKKGISKNLTGPLPPPTVFFNFSSIFKKSLIKAQEKLCIKQGWSFV